MSESQHDLPIYPTASEGNLSTQPTHSGPLAPIARPDKPAPARLSIEDAPDPQNSLLADFERKSQRLGQVQYMLEARLAELTQAVLDEPSSKLPELPGGLQLLDQLERLEQRKREFERLGVSLVHHAANAKIRTEELGGVIPAANKRVKDMSTATAAAEGDARQAESRHDEMCFTTRESLSQILADVLRGLHPEHGETPDSWDDWSEALQKGVQFLQAGREELHSTKLDYKQKQHVLEALRMKAQTAATELEEARRAEANARREFDTELEQMSQRYAELEQLDVTSEDAQREAMAAFARTALEANGSPLSAHPAYRRVQTLSEELETLRTEVSDLQQRLTASE